jgi:hypothetical protein
MIRAYVQDMPFAGLGVSVAIVRHPAEGETDPRVRVLHLHDNEAVSWDEHEPATVVTPTLQLDDDAARALLDALAAHFHGTEDTRALRKDYDAERARCDTLMGALLGCLPSLVVGRTL